MIRVDPARRAPGQTPGRGEAWQHRPRTGREKPRQERRFDDPIALACSSWRAEHTCRLAARESRAIRTVLLVAAALVVAALAWAARAEDGLNAPVGSAHDEELATAPSPSVPIPVGEGGTAEGEGREARLRRVIAEDAEVAQRLVAAVLGHAPGIADGLAYDVALAVARSSRQHGLRPELVCALIRVESDYDPRCSARTDDHGLMQLHRRPTYDVQDNIEAGCAELDEWLEVAHGDERGALARYNGGTRPPAVSWRYADRVLALAGGAR